MSNDTYKYPKIFTLALILLLVLIPLLAIITIVTSFGHGSSVYENTIIFVLCLPIIIMVLAPIAWLLFTLMTTIIVRKEGLIINHVITNKVIKWEDIINVNKISVFSATFPDFGPPRDLEIILKNKKKIKIYYFIRSENASDKQIEDLEHKLRKHISSVNSIGTI